MIYKSTSLHTLYNCKYLKSDDRLRRILVKSSVHLKYDGIVFLNQERTLIFWRIPNIANHSIQVWPHKNCLSQDFSQCLIAACSLQDEKLLQSKQDLRVAFLTPPSFTPAIHLWYKHHRPHSLQCACNVPLLHGVKQRPQATFPSHRTTAEFFTFSPTHRISSTTSPYNTTNTTTNYQQITLQ
jgi:hypothetical protein